MKTFGWISITAIATTVIAFTSVIGIVIIREQLQQIKEQTESSQLTVQQSFRPLGVVRYTHGEHNVRKMTVGIEERTDRFFFEYEIVLKNRGNGLLLNIGSFTFATNKEIRFRDSLLAGRIDTVIFDGMYSHLRHKPLLVDEENNRLILLRHLPFNKSLYVYTMFFYADLVGNLYDTEHLDVFKFDLPVPGELLMIPEFKKEGSYPVDHYNVYNDEESKKLLQSIRKFDHPMVDAISKYILKAQES